jgi:molybdopterin converting factor small subunit
MEVFATCGTLRRTMAMVTLRSPLRELAGGQKELQIEGSTVGEVIEQLERGHPRLTGWVLDEHGCIRQHVLLFVNGEKAELARTVGPADTVHVLPAISGGALQTAVEPATVALDPADVAELLVGTRKGLILLRGPRGGPMEVVSRKFDGQVCEFAVRDPRSGAYFASVTHGQHGPRLYRTNDPLGDWEQADGPAFPEDADWTLERIWFVQPGIEPDVLWAGVAPAALFKSEDGGRSWQLNRGLFDHPTRPSWQPGAGGLALHSICVWPGEPDRLAIAISAAGVWLSDDGGASWRNGNRGLIPRYMPPEARQDTIQLCVHNMHRAALEPTTLYMQFHGGVYRSDDAGESWEDIGTEHGLPSDFGFPMVVDPNDPDRAFVIPLTSDGDRITPEGRMRVYETKDRGRTWWPLQDGLPSGDAFLTILRQAFGHDGRDPLGLYFGAESGEVFGSADGGRMWATVAEHLPPVYSVRSSR